MECPPFLVQTRRAFHHRMTVRKGSFLEGRGMHIGRHDASFFYLTFLTQRPV
jgi:hypothetical protein